jgi:hypothetical protein
MEAWSVETEMHESGSTATPIRLCLCLCPLLDIGTISRRQRCDPMILENLLSSGPKVHSQVVCRTGAQGAGWTFRKDRWIVWGDGAGGPVAAERSRILLRKLSN